MWAIAITLALAQPQADLVGLAAADLSSLPADRRHQARYLTLENVPLAQREDDYLVICGHMQHLSREADIVRPAPIAGSAGALLRIFLDDYGIKRETWEQLADVSPYTHVSLKAEAVEVRQEVRKWPGGVWPKDGKFYPAGAFTYYVDVPIRSASAVKRALAPWMSAGPKGKENLAALVAGTQSQVPMVRADWFFNQSAIQFQRKPGYYDFLGITDEKSYHALVGFTGKRRRTELREATSESGVTEEPRAFTRDDTEGGALWKSLDFIKATDTKNPLRVFGKDIEAEYDASEQFGHLPNNFWATGIFDRNGKRADFAPAEVASDNRSRSNDKKVHVNMSCLRCHGAGGLHPLDAWVRNLAQPPNELLVADAKKARELRQQYGRTLETFMERDKKIFEDAVKEATGWDSKTYLAKYAAYWERYQDAKIDLAWIAQDLNVDAKELRDLIMERRKANNLDTVVSALDLEGPRAKRILIRQYEEVYPILREYLAAKENR